MSAQNLNNSFRKFYKGQQVNWDTGQTCLINTTLVAWERNWLKKKTITGGTTAARCKSAKAPSLSEFF